MKKNYIVAIGVAFLMLLGTIAQAADLSFSGQFRPRLNFDSDANERTTTTAIFDTRVRLNAKATINPKTAIHLQMQSTGQWGVADNGGGGTRVSDGGGGAQVNDSIDDVGFHQAYVTYKGFAGQPVDMKIGRQEVVIGGHRLFGHTGWLQGAQTSDAIRLTHAGGNHTLGYTYIAGQNADAVATAAEGNEHVHIITASTQGIMGGALEGIFVLTEDDNTDATAWEDSQTWYTIGARQKGKVSVLGGLDYRVEFYHQFGDAGAIANTANMGITGNSADGDSTDRDAQMFGLRLGKTFKNASWKPSLTLWYDHLSGTDDDDSEGGDWGTFDTHYDTGHKFYGFMDFFLNRTGQTSGYYGLEDFAIKTKMTPRAGWTAKMDWHHFRTETDLDGADGNTVADNGAAGSAMESDLGYEMDLTLAHKYDANTKIVFGYSHYWSTLTFGMLNGGAAGSGGTAGSDNHSADPTWGYVMIDTKF